ncbi:MFS general substrate transporter [Hypomontagnella submonticulosa]|nr:MFS general substrate transporter [Hypomontagnella submonticulosa]
MGESRKIYPSQGIETCNGRCFWAIFLALSSTVTSTAMPLIASALKAGEFHVWFANAYKLSSTALLPLYGQIADLFGRRWLTITTVPIYALGSVSGGATSAGMLIAGRAVQSAGRGGIILIVEMIVTTWRWVFWINLPIAAVALALLITFLHVNYDLESSVIERLRRIDYVGNGILIPSVIAVLIALTYGGTRYPWASWHVLLPLLLRFSGLGLFIAYESSPWCRRPMAPPYLFRNRTSSAAFYFTFVHSLFSYWALYFLRVYFQGVQLQNPTRFGALLLPTVATIVPGGLVSGVLLTKFGGYRPIHLVAFALMTLGTGLFILLGPYSSPALYVCLQFIGGLGFRFALSTLLPATQAALSEKDTASSSATLAFVRSFGTVWGVSIPAALFNSRCDSLSISIDDVAVRAQIANGQGYSHATSEWALSLSSHARDQVISVFSDSLQLVWIVATAIVGASFFVVFVEKEIKLRNDLETDYGLEKLEKSS